MPLIKRKWKHKGFNVSYIGNTPFTAAFLTDTFSGTGSQTAFTMTVAPANTSSILVVVSGVTQDPSTYSVSGTTLTFSAAPPSGTSNISVRYLGIPASGVTTTAYRTVTNTTATAGQTSFTIPSYTVGYVDVYRNGVYLPTSDYTATTGTTVVLTNAATVGDTITTISFYVSSVLNAIPNSPASVGTSNIVSGVSLASPTLTGTATATTITAPASTALTLQANNGTTGLTLTSAGYPLTPLRPGFRAYVGTTVGVAGGGTVIFNSTAVAGNFLNGSGYSTSTGIYTVPVSGIYTFSVCILWSSLSNGTQVDTQMQVNGSVVLNFGRYMYQANTTGYGGYCEVRATHIASLNAGDLVKVVNSTGTSLNAYGADSTWTWFAGYLIG